MRNGMATAPVRRSSNFRGPLVASVVSLGLITCKQFGIRGEEFLCEEAISHLESCCPSLDARNLCGTYTDGTRCAPPRTWVLGKADRECILATECEDAAPICARVEQAQALFLDDTGVASSDTASELLANYRVCE